MHDMETAKKNVNFPTDLEQMQTINLRLEEILELDSLAEDVEMDDIQIAEELEEIEERIDLIDYRNYDRDDNVGEKIGLEIKKARKAINEIREEYDDFNGGFDEKDYWPDE